MTAPTPRNEALRIAALRRMKVLDQAPEERFDRITRSVAHALHIPTALISLVDADRQWFRSTFGLDVKETPRSVAFCAHTILNDETLVINDATQDARFAANPLVTGPPHIRFYAGVPIKSLDNYPIGTMCIIDQQPRELDPAEREMLALYASWAESELNAAEARKAYSSALRANAYLDSILNSMSDAVVIVDANGRIDAFNVACLAMFNVTKDELMSGNISVLLGAEYQGENGYVRYLTHHASSARLPEVLKDKAGKELIIERRIDRVCVDDQEKHIHVIRDITERIQSDRIKSDFLATAAHELRSPMASVHGFSEMLLQRRVNPAKQRAMLEIVHQQSAQMTRLINELLDLARIEHRGGRAFDMSLETLEPVVKAAVAGFLVPEGRRAPVVRIAKDLPEISIDRDKLQQALINVLSNAYKYSAGDSPVSIDVKWDATGEHVQILVTDRGIGMTEETRTQVFDRFFRGDPSSQVRGTGLGLTLVKEIIEHHGGSVGITSAIGRGTRVTLCLPIRRA